VPTVTAVACSVISSSSSSSTSIPGEVPTRHSQHAGRTRYRCHAHPERQELADAARIDPVSGLIADRDRIREKWEACTPAGRGRIIDSLVIVTVLPCPKGLRRFDPTDVDIVWKTP
jgi:hypothetical protein